MATEGHQDIAFLCLEYRESLDINYAPLIGELSERCNLVRLPTTAIALRYLENCKPRSIIVTDGGISKPWNYNMVQRLKDYIEDGGWVIFALDFASSTVGEEFDNFFGHGFGIPWEYGGRFQMRCEFNQGCTIPIGPVPGPDYSYDIEVHAIKNALPVEQIVVPLKDATRPEKSSSAAVVGKQLGNGFLIYCGNERVEVDLYKVLMSVCNWQWLI
ncbi:hypothetical protein BO78DRAFT_167138 [Aspergillus sclerotiicarbonarius CBS 121057]|uniref:Uncharacterized protein n=1 Tax=Aspergillus sclerotiicarbonarius (strain CBS 121057 / IBT 28362) TaxID=1448318 RepID=A0A319E979_ASPSB|nr:hypothetical protein BO78DRAFT_167138 [Aspergillus sclerotiicarbonarius CBS 121057]